MKDLINKVAREVIEGFREDGEKVAVKAITKEVLEILFDVEGYEASEDEVKVIVKGLL